MFHSSNLTSPPFPHAPERPMYPAGAIAHPRATFSDDDVQRWTVWSFMLWALGAMISLLHN